MTTSCLAIEITIFYKAGPQDKRRLIFYYFASQILEKITKKRKTIRNSQVKNSQMQMPKVEYSHLEVFSWLQQQQGKKNQLPLEFQVFHSQMESWFWEFLVSAVFSYNFSQILFEPIFVQKKPEVYSFSVFDFALAKKEARLKQLRAELTSDSSNAAYF
ncbi:unnamed protein product (macronuclear) [Paramecium tetraurelia]|uniref:Uncharacterized protein n=1 Tax=Paramecium tetraurelia TaxID=5888 RepID=A0CCX1_PARTE|nr:uncharacterized protein GSPATT00037423001 [Paramecium tetraurelia]CAK68638.1 unnamed protein product [Paramecium tetraurelia]|eukprot:XP_001436035.1 hypothetical protein (macronuclear) [Paramecium tetraurelia strain d4-2]